MTSFIVLLTLAVGALLAFWRVYLSPWASFPGPKLGALTSWYAWYWQVYKKGQLTSHLEDLHEVYGPVVRYGPKHIHFNDPALYKEIYRWNPTYGKDPAFYGTPRYCSSFRETSIEKHATRRQVLSRMFSPTAVRQRMPIIAQHCDKMLQKLSGLTQAGYTKVNVFNLSRSVAADVLSAYISGATFGCMDDDEKGFDGGFVRAIQHTSDTYFDDRNPFLVRWRSIKQRFSGHPPVMDETLNELIFSDGLVEDYLARRESLAESEDQSVFSILLRSGVTKNFNPLSKPELIAEGRSLLAAGVNTVGFTLSATLYYIARDKNVQLNLQTELDVYQTGIAGDGPKQFADLPYLAACIKEGYRLSGTVKCSLPRVAGKQGARVGDYFVPEGTVFGMGSGACHLSPGVFEKPLEFMPMRWINNDPGKIQAMNANLHPYSRGPRECLGKELAHAVICVIIAGLLQKNTLAIPGTAKEIDRISTFETLPREGRIDLLIRPR
ncbi:cytochrome P450 [Penicillium bovifimosum]|uniref:Cytochrome P450 n=1 Tax=Penicillium bovifimosum TaxID=126998 RepID=A0A9W9HFX8_9EURO|nr:cytochrome P450 [Penicillium bovifimosum]KAJ5146152.1 cytochrome P450 [Penicillium bovifimosum]